MEDVLFDREKALKNAMLVFWERGYSNTSLKDLLGKMNILNGSFYNTFKSKKEVFIQALELYGNTVLSERIEAFRKSDNFKNGLRSFLKQILKDSEGRKYPCGCMVVSAIDEELLKDAGIQKVVRAKVDMLRQFLKSEVQKAQESKEIRTNQPSEVIAEFLMMYTEGFIKSLVLDGAQAKHLKQIEYLIASL